MELWKERINSQNTTISTMHNINGAQAINEVFDYLFYTEFSEDDVIPFFEIFDKFNQYYDTKDTDNCIRQLDNTLSKQIQTTSVSPLEIILYASRKINKYIECNENIFNAITDILQNHIEGSYKSVNCMAKNWEWKLQLLMLAEACGKSSDSTAISIMMESYERIVSLFEPEVDKVHRTFLRMILHSNNEDNIKYIVDIISSNSFINNPNGLKLIKNLVLSKYSFVSSCTDEFVECLNKKNLPSFFKSKITKYVGINTDAPSTIQEWEWGKRSIISIIRLEKIKDETELPGIINLFMENWDKITGKECQQRALYTIAEKAKESKDPEIINSVLEFCDKILSTEKTDIFTGAYIGLYALGKEEAMETAISNAFSIDNNYSSLVTLANYFRFRRYLIDTFIDFIERELIQSDWDINTIRTYINNLSIVIDKFDGGERNDRLSTSIKFNSRVIEISKHILKQTCDNSICNDLLSILHKIGSESPTQKNSVLQVLDSFKDSHFDISSSILRRVDGIISKLDGIAPPQ